MTHGRNAEGSESQVAPGLLASEERLAPSASPTTAKLVTREELKGMVGEGNATGVVFDGITTEDRRLFEKRVREQGQPTQPNRASRRYTKKVRQKAITKKRVKRG
jgi:hypothetical protein